jgi:exodeoxyribonuclease-5
MASLPTAVSNRSIVIGSDSVLLTQSQSKLVDELLDFIKPSNNRNKFVLTGAAGTGKSTVIVYIIKEILKKHSSGVCLTATTNKAVAVLEKFVASHRLRSDNEKISLFNKDRQEKKVDTKTIHSLLGLKVKNNMNGGKDLVKEGRSSTVDYGFVIVDEASMVDSKLLDYINEDMKIHRFIKFIFIGDVAQLPPINENQSMIFDQTDFELKEVVRQSLNNPILKLATHIRITDDSTIDMSTFEKLLPDKSGLSIVDQETFNNYITKAFTSSSAKDVDSFRVIAWTNAKVAEYNDMIKSVKFDKELNIGEYIRIREPIVEYSTSGKSSVILNAQAEGWIEKMKIGEHPNIQQGILFHKTLFVDFITKEKTLIYIPTSEAKIQLEELINALIYKAREEKIGTKRRELWFQVFAIKDQIADAVPAYAITAHSSQGSTYNTVFIDVLNISRNRDFEERMRCFYVSLTRAKKRVVLNNRYLG